jgi:hypothetical protein
MVFAAMPSNILIELLTSTHMEQTVQHVFAVNFMPDTFDSRNHAWARFVHAFCLWLYFH